MGLEGFVLSGFGGDEVAFGDGFVEVHCSEFLFAEEAASTSRTLAEMDTVKWSLHVFRRVFVLENNHLFFGVAGGW